MEGDVDAEMIFSKGREVEVTSDEEGFKGAWFTATILKYPENKTKDKALVQYKNLLEDDNQTPLTEHVKLSFIRPLPPQPKIPVDDDQCFEVQDVVDAFHLDGWWTGSVSQVIDNPKRYIVSFAEPPEEIEFSSSDLRPHWEWVDGKWVKPSKFQEVMVSSDCKELVDLSCNTTKDAGTIIQLGSSYALKCSSKKRELCCGSLRKNEMGLLTVSKEPAKSKHVTQAAPESDATPLHPCKKSKDGSLANSLVPESHMKEIKQQKEHGAKTGINRTGQPHNLLKIKQPKLVRCISQSPSAGKGDAAGVLEEMVSEERTATEVESSAISGLEHAGSQTMSTERTAGSVTDCQGQIIKVAGESGGILHENEEQSPLICFKELQPGLRKIPSVVMGENNSGLIPHGFANQWNDPREKLLEIMAQSPLVGMTGDNEPEGQCLPFIKSLPMWKSVESMEIFQVMPQNPHFHPLVELKEILREGLAVGHMLSFASLVHRTSKLTVADPRNLFTSILDALPDLEILGFDVKEVRDRTSDLLFLKDRYGQLQHQSKEVKLQVKQYSDELTKINEEIDANYKMVRELEEKQALLLSMKESKISQITSLQACADVTTQDIQSVEYDFESLAGSPW